MEDLEEAGQTHVFIISNAHGGLRIDKALSDLASADLSRARIQKLIEAGHVSLNGELCDSASRKLAYGDEVEVFVPPPQESLPRPENIALNIVYEDSDLLVIDKPAGLVVHPGAGHRAGTLVNALLHHCAGSLSGIGGVLRPGIVHRLDKDTSGLIVAAKNDLAHQGLSAQLSERTLSRIYRALVLGAPVPNAGYVDQPIGRDHRNRQKMAVNAKYGREACTHYQLEAGFPRLGTQSTFSLIMCRLETGRTHQIRVHMNFIKLPLIGDPLYGPQPTAVKASAIRAGYDSGIAEALIGFNRQALHASEMTFIHPATGKEMQFTSPLPQDISNILKLLQKN